MLARIENGCVVAIEGTPQEVFEWENLKNNSLDFQEDEGQQECDAVPQIQEEVEHECVSPEDVRGILRRRELMDKLEAKCGGRDAAVSACNAWRIRVRKDERKVCGHYVWPNWQSISQSWEPWKRLRTPWAYNAVMLAEVCNQFGVR